MTETAKGRGEVSTQVHSLTVQESIACTLDQASRTGQPIKALAEDTRIPGARLYNCYEGRQHLWAEEVPVLVRATRNPLIVSTIARACGGAFVPLPIAPGTLQSDLLAATKAMDEFADTMRAFSAAIADGRMSDAEADHVAAQGHQAVTAILALVEHAQQRAGAKAKVRA